MYIAQFVEIKEEDMIKLRPDSSGNLCIQKNAGQLRMIPTSITGTVDDSSDQYFDGWVYRWYEDGDNWGYSSTSNPSVSLSLSHSRASVIKEVA